MQRKREREARQIAHCPWHLLALRVHVCVTGVVNIRTSLSLSGLRFPTEEEKSPLEKSSIANLDQAVEATLGVVNISADRSFFDLLLEEAGVSPKSHLVLEAVRSGTTIVLLAVLPGDKADEGHHLLVNEATETDPEVCGDVTNGPGQLQTNIKNFLLRLIMCSLLT